MDKYEELKQIIKSSDDIVFFTGAGISVPSGIPDFRSSDGLYNTDLKAEEIISHSYFINNPKEFFDFYKKKMIFKNAKPNKAHKWISELEKIGKCKAVITQNIDGLHHMAGSKNVIELHGTIHNNYCMKCHKQYGLDAIMNFKDIPYCECGGIIKPDVVLYEESLDNQVIKNAITAISNAKTLIVIGTSLVVYPAASFIRYFTGDKLILLNKSNTPYDNIADLVINDDIINIISKI